MDLDNTILACDPPVQAAWQKICGRYGPRLGCPPEQLHAAIVAEAARWGADPQRALRARLDPLATRHQLVDTVLTHLGLNRRPAWEIALAYSITWERAIYPLPGAVEALTQWRAAGVRLALVANGAATDLRRWLLRFDLVDYFDAVLIEEECGAGKPDRRIFELALQRLDLRPAQACMVGDDLRADVAGAQRLGICAVWVDTAGCGLPAHAPVRPDHTVRSLAELLLAFRGVPAPEGQPEPA